MFINNGKKGFQFSLHGSGGGERWFRIRSLTLCRVIHESGQLSIWLQRELMRFELPATCIDARKAQKGAFGAPQKI